MKERGIIVGIGGGIELMLLTYRKCWFGHSWTYHDSHSRTCSSCAKHMTYNIVDFGRSKCWCWTRKP